MKSNSLKKIWGFTLLVFSFPVFSLEEGEVSVVLAGSAGMVWSEDSGKNLDFNQGFSQYHFNHDEKNNTRGIFGGLLGVEWLFEDNWAWQSGIAYYQTTPFSAQGTLVQGFNPQTFQDIPYHYKMVAHQLLWENKLLTVWRQRFHPYISVGLGLSFNETRDYQANFPPFELFTPLYENHTKTSFSYNVGLGVDYDINQHWRLGIGYRFTDFGKASLGNGFIDTTPAVASPHQSHWYAQEVLAQLTWVY